MTNARGGNPIRTGTLSNGMAYLAVGNGPKVALLIEGGPGIAVPTGAVRRQFVRWVKPRRRRLHRVECHSASGHADRA